MITTSYRRLLVSIILLLTTLVRPHLALGKEGPQTEMVAMSDGVKLATDIYLPEEMDGPHATILVRTPYNKNGMKAGAQALVNAGYAVVVQDMRGRFASEGHHAIIFGNDGLGNEHQDGHDTMRWVAEQPWSNGKIATWGGSALGIVQNMTAPNAPEALKGQIVLVAFSEYYHQAAYQGGAWRKELLEGWLITQKMEDVNLPAFLEHSTYDDFWKRLSADSRAHEVNAPGVYVGGWYDIFLQGTINSFVKVHNEGGPNARGKCYLVLGPLAHGEFSQRVEYPNSQASAIHSYIPVGMFDHWLKGENNLENVQPVHYYVMGDVKDKSAPGNVWRAADNWPPPADPTPFYFHGDQRLVKEMPAGEEKHTYKYDPQNPVPTMGGQNLLISKGPMDQRSIEARDDVLLFTSEPLSESLEVTGRITAKLYIESDCPDTDFTVKLSDVYPDGESLLVTDGIQRASLRNSFETRELLEQGRIYEVCVDLWSTSLIFNKGHCIRIAVSSSNAPRFEPNPNTGDPHPVNGKSRIATNTLHLSPTHPSHIVLPVYNGP